MKKWNLAIAILMTIFVFLTSASLNPPAAAGSCARSNFDGIWRKSWGANPGDEINSVEFYPYGNYCNLQMSIDGNSGIAMTFVNKNKLKASFKTNTGVISVIAIYTKLSSSNKFVSEKMTLVRTVTQNNRVTFSYTQTFTRAQLK